MSEETQEANSAGSAAQPGWEALMDPAVLKARLAEAKQRREQALARRAEPENGERTGETVRAERIRALDMALAGGSEGPATAPDHKPPRVVAAPLGPSPARASPAHLSPARPPRQVRPEPVDRLPRHAHPVDAPAGHEPPSRVGFQPRPLPQRSSTPDVVPHRPARRSGVPFAVPVSAPAAEVAEPPANVPYNPSTARQQTISHGVAMPERLKAVIPAPASLPEAQPVQNNVARKRRHLATLSIGLLAGAAGALILTQWPFNSAPATQEPVAGSIEQQTQGNNPPLAEPPFETAAVEQPRAAAPVVQPAETGPQVEAAIQPPAAAPELHQPHAETQPVAPAAPEDPGPAVPAAEAPAAPVELAIETGPLPGIRAPQRSGTAGGIVTLSRETFPAGVLPSIEMATATAASLAASPGGAHLFAPLRYSGDEAEAIRGIEPRASLHGWTPAVPQNPEYALLPSDRTPIAAPPAEAAPRQAPVAQRTATARPASPPPAPEAAPPAAPAPVSPGIRNRMERAVESMLRSHILGN